MGIWSEPYETDLRILTNGDELELGLTIRLGSVRRLAGNPKALPSALSWSTEAPNTSWLPELSPSSV